MNLPTFTKNEKVVLISSVLVTIIFWASFIGYVLFRLNQIMNRERPPINLDAYRLPTSSPTANLSPTLSTTSQSVFQLTRFTDPEYNFSFHYPSELTIKEATREEKIKHYFLINPSTTEQILADLYIINQDYQEKTAELKALVKSIQGQNKTKETKPVFFTERLLNGQEIAIAKFPAPGETFYTSAIYPLEPEGYLRLVIRPEFYLNYLAKLEKERVSNMVDQLVYSVKLLDNEK